MHETMKMEVEKGRQHHLLQLSKSSCYENKQQISVAVSFLFQVSDFVCIKKKKNRVTAEQGLQDETTSSKF